MDDRCSFSIHKLNKGDWCKPERIVLNCYSLLKFTSAKYSVGADILSSASVYSETDRLWLKSSFDVDKAIGMTELADSFMLTELFPFGSSIIMTWVQERKANVSIRQMKFKRNGKWIKEIKSIRNIRMKMKGKCHMAFLHAEKTKCEWKRCASVPQFHPEQRIRRVVSYHTDTTWNL